MIFIYEYIEKSRQEHRLMLADIENTLIRVYTLDVLLSWRRRE